MHDHRLMHYPFLGAAMFSFRLSGHPRIRAPVQPMRRRRAACAVMVVTDPSIISGRGIESAPCWSSRCSRHPACGGGGSQLRTSGYETRTPFADWPRRRKVLISSPSPQTVIPESRLYHWPSGTSGSASSHFASNSSCVAGIWRLWIRSRRCWKRAGGRFWRRTFGTAVIRCRKSHA